MKSVTDLEAERLAHAVSNSDDLCLPTNPKGVLQDMLNLRPSVPVNVSGYHSVNVKGVKKKETRRWGSRLKKGRNADLIAFVDAGNSFDDAAAFFKLSYERVRQIVRRGY